MASGTRFVCGHCAAVVEAWSDGNPYYLDPRGQKHYAYHPDHEALGKCVGNDVPHLCLDCGKDFKVDSRDPVRRCPGCGSENFVGTYRLEGERCPTCKNGKFAVDPDFRAIS